MKQPQLSMDGILVNGISSHGVYHIERLVRYVTREIARKLLHVVMQKKKLIALLMKEWAWELPMQNFFSIIC